MKKYLLLLSFPLLVVSSANSAKLPSSEPTEKPVTESVKTMDETVKLGLEEFNSLSSHDKKTKLKEFKKLVKDYKKDKKAGKAIDSNTLLHAIIALFIPPLGVYLHEGSTNNKFWITVLLTILGLLIFGFAGVLLFGTLPSIVYALIVILGG